MVYRVYVEKKPGFALEADALLKDIRSFLRIESLKGLRLLNRYDVEGAAKRRICSTARCAPFFPRRSSITPRRITRATGILCSRWNICPASTTSARTAPRSACSWPVPGRARRWCKPRELYALYGDAHGR